MCRHAAGNFDPKGPIDKIILEEHTNDWINGLPRLEVMNLKRFSLVHS